MGRFNPTRDPVSVIVWKVRELMASPVTQDSKEQIALHLEKAYQLAGPCKLRRKAIQDLEQQVLTS